MGGSQSGSGGSQCASKYSGRLRRCNAATDDEDGSTSEEEDSAVDKLATSTRTGVLREVMTPKLTLPQHPEDKPVIKNVLTEDWQYAQVKENTVLLHVYDLEEDLKGANNVLAFAVDEITIGGAFHVGVEVFGSEWSYGSRGVKCEAPRSVEGHVYRCTVPLGCTRFNKEEVASILHDLCRTWRGADYDLLNRNCCCFAAELCRRLGVEDLPAWVDRLARLLQGGRDVGRGVLEVGGRLRGGLKGAIGHAADLVGELLHEQAGAPKYTYSASSFAMTSSLSMSTASPVAQQSLSSVTEWHAPAVLRSFQAPALLEEDASSKSFSSGGPWSPSSSTTAVAFRPPLEGTTLRFATVDRQGSGIGKLPSTVNLKDSITGRGQQQPTGFVATVAAPFPVGAAVEYWSTTYRRWLSTKVLAFNAPSGLYDLDCRSDAPVERIRWPLVGGEEDDRRAAGTGSVRAETGGPLPTGTTCTPGSSGPVPREKHLQPPAGCDQLPRPPSPGAPRGAPMSTAAPPMRPLSPCASPGVQARVVPPPLRPPSACNLPGSSASRAAPDWVTDLSRRRHSLEEGVCASEEGARVLSRRR